MILFACKAPEQKRETTYERIEPFKISFQKRNLVTKLSRDTSYLEVFETDLDVLKRVVGAQLDEITLIVPNEIESETLELDLSKIQILSSDFRVTVASTGSTANIKQGVHYRGVIKDVERSHVAITIFENEVSGLVTTDKGNFVIGRLADVSSNNEHLIYDDRPVFLRQEFNCQLTTKAGVYDTKILLESPSVDQAVRNCIGIYLEADNDIFVKKGGLQQSADYVLALFNQVAMLYAIERINIVISELLIWDIESPYSGASGQAMLDSFKANTDEFNGELAQLLSIDKGSGGVAEFAGVCHTNPDLKKSFSNIGSTFVDIPTYSWSVEVIAHELGHLFGSKHTQACVWNEDNTAIDGCAEPEEGTCPQPDIPSEGGTIMSYCHLTSVGIKFNLGFGAQPGNVIRNSVSTAACCTCADGEVGDVLAAEGRITLLRVHDVGTKYGPPSDELDVEVVVWLDNFPPRAFGFKLRSTPDEKTHKAMLDQLRDTFNRNRRARIEYTKTGCQTGEISRVIELM